MRARNSSTVRGAGLRRRSAVEEASAGVGVASGDCCGVVVAGVGTGASVLAGVAVVLAGVAAGRAGVKAGAGVGVGRADGAVVLVGG